MTPSPTGPLTLQAASDSLAQGLRSGDMFVGRAGETELGVWRNLGRRESVVDRLKIRAKAKINAGIWPPTGGQLLDFSMAYEGAFACTTHVGTWGNLESEGAFLDWSAPLAQRVPLRTLDPVLLAADGVSPWSSSLSGMTVLIVAPFAELAAEQMARRSTIFRTDFEVLPKFDVTPLVPPQTQALSVPRANWSQDLKDAQAAIDRVAPNVDAAILSAGAYGMPLAAHASSLGIPVIYVGGALQLLFGIGGARWANSPHLASIRGQGWVQPSKRAKPLGSRLVEGGAYW